MRNHERIMIAILAGLLAAAAPARAEESRPAAIDTNAPAKAKLSDDELGDLLQQAIMLARVGLYDEAEVRCKQILAQKPDQPTVKQLLTEIEEKRAQAARSMPGVELRRQLETLIVPEVKLREAVVADVIEFLRAESKKLLGDKNEINFIWQVPPDRPVPKITLSLRNVPMLDVIRYVTEFSRLSYRIDSHAVVIYVPEGAEPAKAAPAPGGQHGQP